jgi:hypothetical protein
MLGRSIVIGSLVAAFAAGASPSTSGVPRVAFGEPATKPATGPKFVALRVLLRSNGELKVLSTRMGYGRLATTKLNPNELKIQLIGDRGRAVGTLRAWDPLGRRVYTPTPDGGIEESYLIDDEAIVEILVPFEIRLKSVRFSGPALVRGRPGRANANVEANVTTTIRRFCAHRVKDRDCGRWLQTYPRRR